MLLLPEQSPPQMTEDAKMTLASYVLEDGITQVATYGYQKLQSEQEFLAEYIDDFCHTLDQLSTELAWPGRVIRLGAGITMLAYRETGYYQPITEEGLALGSEVATAIGIPEAYVSSTMADPNLVALTSIVLEDRLFLHDRGGYYQTFLIGAGITRHYMQQSLVA